MLEVESRITKKEEEEEEREVEKGFTEPQNTQHSTK